MKVTFIGAGNLAWHLAPAFDNAGHYVQEVYSLHPKNAKKLTSLLYRAEVKTTLDFSDSESHLFVIAVSDDSIEEVASKIILPPEAILIHTSGCKSLEILNVAGTLNIGVFYPIQIFHKERKINFKNISLLIECENESIAQELIRVGKDLCNKVERVSSQERMILNLASVFISNFNNHLVTISKNIVSDSKFSFEMFKPLLRETIDNCLQIGSENAQGGVAYQGDMETLDIHYEHLLKREPEYAVIYKLISQNIIDYYSK